MEACISPKFKRENSDTVNVWENFIVMVKDEIPRELWKLGKIIELIISLDGKVRSVKIKLASGRVIGRPIHLQFPLEIQSNLDIISKIPTSNTLCERRPLRKAAVIAN